MDQRGKVRVPGAADAPLGGQLQVQADQGRAAGIESRKTAKVLGREQAVKVVLDARTNILDDPFPQFGGEWVVRINGEGEQVSRRLRMRLIAEDIFPTHQLVRLEPLPETFVIVIDGPLRRTRFEGGGDQPPKQLLLPHDAHQHPKLQAEQPCPNAERSWPASAVAPAAQQRRRALRG